MYKDTKPIMFYCITYHCFIVYNNLSYTKATVERRKENLDYIIKCKT